MAAATFPMDGSPSAVSRDSRQARAQSYFENLQNNYCEAFERLDGKGTFSEDSWRHTEHGGGKTRVLQDGALFEKAGVNFSAVGGMLSESLAGSLGVLPQQYFATGVSLILHPLNPKIPTVHANFRFLELGDGIYWFGGGADLTPSYLFEEDARAFHRTWKKACDAHDPQYYARFKRWCDEYFVLRHRNETRGIGGIFFDSLKGDFEKHFRFVQTCGGAFLDSFVPIIERRRTEPWGEEQKLWQLLRRARYAEFNLLYDRGTAFGLGTQGRIESILISLPPIASWRYDVHPAPGSPEELLMDVLRKPRDWVA